MEKSFGFRQTRFDWGCACSPLVHGDSLLFDPGRTLALDKHTGKLLWSSAATRGRRGA